MIDQYLAHQTRSQGDEVTMILNHHVMPSRQPQVGFMDESGGLECVIGTLSPQMSARCPTQLLVDQRQKVPQSLRVARPPFEYQLVGGPVSQSGKPWWMG
ncbi:MAG: hypothetical protein WA642_09895, partial [Steroidobacteraceae bacterium]